MLAVRTNESVDGILGQSLAIGSAGGCELAPKSGAAFMNQWSVPGLTFGDFSGLSAQWRATGRHSQCIHLERTT